MIGDGPQLLTHYYDDARTMYQVFRRGLSISGERGHWSLKGLGQRLSQCKGRGEPAWYWSMASEWCPGPEGSGHFWPSSYPVREVATLCG